MDIISQVGQTLNWKIKEQTHLTFISTIASQQYIFSKISIYSVSVK